MSFPSTPTKKGDGINQIVRRLNAQWGLNLSVRESLWSPSKVPNPDSKEERIFRLIRFLYFKHFASLQDAIRKFELHASRQTSSKWVFKPGADPDTLSLRAAQGSPSGPNGSVKQTHLSGSVIDALKDTLLHLLSEARDYPLEDTTETLTHRLGYLPSQYEASESSQLQCSDQIYPPLTKPGRQGDVPPNHPDAAEDSLSDDCSLDQEIADSLSKLHTTNTFQRRESRPQMINRGAQLPLSSSKQRIDDDVFSTPPTSPSTRLGLFPTPSISMIEPAKEDDQDDGVFFQEPDLVKLPQVTPPLLKRRSLEHVMPPFTRNISFEPENPKPPRLLGVHHMIPLTSIANSFDSLPSSSSSTSTASTARTPPTSSYFESATTSFNSLDGADESFPVRSAGRASESHNQKCGSSFDGFREPDLDADHCQFGSTLQWPITPSKSSSSLLESVNFASEVFELLNQESPFIPLKLPAHLAHSFRQIYEMSRVALHYEMSLTDLFQNLRRENGERGEFWSSLERVCKKQGKTPPQRSAPSVWKKTEKSFQGVGLSGELSFVKKASGPIFKFSLNPLKLEKPHRFSNKFDGDRFLVLGLPGFEQKDLPLHLQNNAPAVRDAIISWIVDRDHVLLGRTWRAFYIKPKDDFKTRKSKQRTSDVIRHRVYLFAVTGHGFISSDSAKYYRSGQKLPHVSMTVTQLLDWFIPVKSNMEQPALKLFARLSLGVSPIQPMVEFKPHQIIRTRDAFADSPTERRLSTDRHWQERLRRTWQNKEISGAAVMNDGCARISRAAAAAIVRSLNLNSYTPSVFQGRIGGAKGVWMVDVIGETLPELDDDFWIEVTDSQLKFRGHTIDETDPDPVRLTFGSVRHSMPLSSHTLNFQLIPILVDRGVPDKVLMQMLEDDLTDRVNELRDAMDDGLKLRKWNQENNSVTEERIQNGTIKMQGALPELLAERINWFVEHGFEPQACNYLKLLCSKTVIPHCERLEDRGNIRVGRSAYALMIADPLGVLEENEIHLGFSNTFKDSKSQFQDTLLNDMEVLVARLPAHLPSDIQKVRAVFRPELSSYKDVIVFPTQGQYSLASKLSGGDYDGDKAWICWEPELVAPFVNADVHPSQDLEFYGITKDRTKVSDLISEPDFTSLFLRKGFEFSIEQSLMGKCTNYHESFCYAQQSIASPMAKDMAVLLGYLVDSAKGGLMFTNQTWMDFLERNKLRKYLPPPAYKDKKSGNFTEYVMDRLVLLAKRVKDDALESLTKYFKDKTRDYDHDLVVLWKDVNKEAKADTELKEILNDLCSKLQMVKDYWSLNSRGKDADGGSAPSSSFVTVAEKAREMFLDIRPLEGSRHPMAKHWTKQVERWETVTSRGQDEWSMLKASALFSNWQYGAFPWYVAGTELGRLKLKSRSSHEMVESMYVRMKLDGKFFGGQKEEDTEDGDEWDEWDEWDEVDEDV